MNSAYPTLPIPKNRPPYTGCSPSTLTSCSGDPCTASIASTSAVQEATKTAGPGVQRRHGPSSASVAMTTMMYPFDLLGSIAGMWFDNWDARGTETVVAVIGIVVASMVVQPVLTVVPAVLYDDARAEADPTPFFSGQGDR